MTRASVAGGIPIVRNFSDGLRYRHEDGRNCLTLLFLGGKTALGDFPGLRDSYHGADGVTSQSTTEEIFRWELQPKPHQ